VKKLEGILLLEQSSRRLCRELEEVGKQNIEEIGRQKREERLIYIFCNYLYLGTSDLGPYYVPRTTVFKILQVVTFVKKILRLL